MTRDNHSDDLWDEFERTRPVESAGSEVLAVMPADRDELIGHLGEALRAKLDMPVFLDDDGDYELHHLGQPVWVSVQRRSPSVTIMARVAHGVYSRRATAVELGILNRDHLQCRWELRDRDVWQLATFPAAPFAPMHLSLVLDQFFTAMASTRDDLAYRIGAKVA
ncbi:T3SS (YopN, CesT) and YbjN peptide-binding chaperone 1 [Gordonia iterans]